LDRVRPPLLFRQLGLGGAELNDWQGFFFYFLAGDSETMSLTGLTGGPHSQWPRRIMPREY
jgi:hypothetical protein